MDFLMDLEEFISFACQQTYSANGKIRYPCSKSRNKNYIIPEEVKVHLYMYYLYDVYYLLSTLTISSYLVGLIYKFHSSLVMKLFE